MSAIDIPTLWRASVKGAVISVSLQEGNNEATGRICRNQWLHYSPDIPALHQFPGISAGINRYLGWNQYDIIFKADKLNLTARKKSYFDHALWQST